MPSPLQSITAADGSVIALVLRADYQTQGIAFFTPPEFSQQLAYMNRPAGHVVRPHVHNPVSRTVTTTQEVLFVRSGRVRVDLFDNTHAAMQSVELATGDVILLASGGHGIEMLEPSELIEVKQGPFAGDHDKAFIDDDTGHHHGKA